MSIMIKNAEIISHSTNGRFNIYIENGRIIEITKNQKKAKVTKVIDANGYVIIPGIIDMHTHLRDPGFEYKETIETGLKAAIHGGVTTLGVMPNTKPSLDNLESLQYIEEKSRKTNLSKIIPIPAITKKREGKIINDLKKFSKYGYRFFSDDGDPVWDDEIMLKALQITKEFNGIIINHCEDKRFLGKEIFESLMVARDIELSKFSNSHVHIAHISTSNTLDLIKYAKTEDLKVSCEITFHHLLLEKEKNNTLKKINPPLPDKDTQKYLINNLDYIDIIVSDHAPHTLKEKNKDYENAPNGISGLDIFLPAIYTLSKKHKIDFKYLIEKTTYNPSKNFKLSKIGDIKEGYSADLVIFNPKEEWDKIIYSKGKNMPYKQLYGKVLLTMIDGKIKYNERGF
ncbi:dihydroorotase [Marinitoga sp. 1197]|uniref:dihydroorotase n=1 Tax=Marinitoga sp. 1197 TaxID=1428449 RepID=UPI0006415B2B|nr:dihydroorotase [Marinitoga sp. 1197]